MAKKKTTVKKDKVTKISGAKTKGIVLVDNEPKLPMSTFASADMLLQQLAGKDVDIDKMEKILALKGKYEAEENKKKYQREFSNLQAELPSIKKTKSVYTKSGDHAFNYAPLEKIIEQIKPILQKFGFSYRWSEGMNEDKTMKRVYCHIMAYGHEEKSFVDIPNLETNKLTNKAQMAGQTSTYGKRYSLIGGLGIMTDDDTDCGGTYGETGNVQAVLLTKEEINKMGVALKKLKWDKNKIDEFVEFIMTNKKKTWEELDATEQRMIYDSIIVESERK